MSGKELVIGCLGKFSGAESTVGSYRKGAKVFIEYMGERELDAELFIAYPGWVRERGYAKKSVGVYVSAVQALLNILLIEGKFEMTYSQSIRWKMARKECMKQREARLPKFPKRDDVSRMIEAVRGMVEESPRKERNIALILFLASSGCRNAETKGLKIGDVDMEEGSALVTGKGNKQRRVFFSPEAKEALRIYLSFRSVSDEQPLFARHDKGTGKKVQSVSTTTIRDIVKEVADLAGVNPFSPHYFRHNFAITMLEKTRDLALVQDLLGHASPIATRVYAKIYPETLKARYKEVYG